MREHLFLNNHGTKYKPLNSAILSVILDGEEVFFHVYQYVPNQLKSIQSLTFDDGLRLGDELRRFYSIDTTFTDFPVGWWGEPDIIEKRIELFQPPQEIVSSLRKLRDQVIPTLQDTILQQPEPPQNLIHGDPHSANIIWDVNNYPILIDFESIKIEYVECDIAALYQHHVQMNSNTEMFQGILAGADLNDYNTELFYIFLAARNLTSTSFWMKNKNWALILDNLNEQASAFQQKRILESVDFFN